LLKCHDAVYRCFIDDTRDWHFLQNFVLALAFRIVGRHSLSIFLEHELHQQDILPVAIVSILSHGGVDVKEHWNMAVFGFKARHFHSEYLLLSTWLFYLRFGQVNLPPDLSLQNSTQSRIASIFDRGTQCFHVDK